MAIKTVTGSVTFEGSPPTVARPRHATDIITDLRARAHQREQDIRNDHAYPSAEAEDKAVAECTEITLLREAADRLAHAMRPVDREQVRKGLSQNPFYDMRNFAPATEGAAWHASAVASGEIEGK